MTWMQRRALGVTVSSVMEAAKRINEDIGQEQWSQMSDSEIAALIMVGLNIDLQAAEVDWEAILAFIEALLPIILRLIELFQ